MSAWGGSARRMTAMVERYMYLLKGSWPRLVELAYWPTMQIILWGFLSEYLVGHSSYLARASGILLAAVLLWDVMFRGQLGVSVVFFEELYSRNLGHLFASPLRAYELAGALAIISFLRTVIGVGVAAYFASLFYHFAIWRMGWVFVAFFFNLLAMGWAIGLLVAGLVLRYGLGAENLAWAAVFAIAPVSGIYYPITILPHWLQAIAHWLPAAYVFMGLRALLFHHVVASGLLWHAAWLNLLGLSVGVGVFLYTFRDARLHGRLLNLGE
ncbi:MAG: ABC transporter permease [Gammaproteobacteria bacterium]|nr:ABC transporter permease [Gammaproteobacteria bacterium]